jgi:hypothetical protein
MRSEISNMTDGKPFARGYVLACGVIAALCAPGTGAEAAALAIPGMSGPVAANPNRMTFNAGPVGSIYVTVAASALASWQSNHAPGDVESALDISNGQVFVQKTDGLLQFYLQAGVYSIPALGTPYLKASDTLSATCGALPQGFLKIAANDSLSILVGKLPTLIGNEYTFTFENMNIERGLLWNQEPALSRGVQVNYAGGPVSLALSWNDGFYSNRFNWISRSLGYTIDMANSVSLVGGGNFGRTQFSSFATPLLQNNGRVYNLIYTHTGGPWTISPYIQFTDIPAESALGIARGASTTGGAVLASYAVDDNWKIAGRVEYIASSGNAKNGTPNLLYGPGSDAWSFYRNTNLAAGAFLRPGRSILRLGWKHGGGIWIPTRRKQQLASPIDGRDRRAVLRQGGCDDA